MSACPHPEKVPHRNKRSALKARDSFEQVKGVQVGLEPYPCQCGRWHLGNKRNKGRMPGWARRAGLDRLEAGSK